MDLVQMFGRAGRDGSPATGVLVTSRGVEQDLKGYCGTGCRRDTISLYLDGKRSPCGLGDNRYDVCSPNKEAIHYAMAAPVGVTSLLQARSAVVICTQPNPCQGWRHLARKTTKIATGPPINSELP